MTFFARFSAIMGVVPVLATGIVVCGLPSSGQAAHKEIASHRNQFQLDFADDEVVTKQSETYFCSAGTKKPTEVQKALLGSLPADHKVSVTYVSADITSLAILPLDGKILVFTNVVAADGSKYVADRYVWWSKGDQATFAQFDDDKNTPLNCKLVKSP